MCAKKKLNGNQLKSTCGTFSINSAGEPLTLKLPHVNNCNDILLNNNFHLERWIEQSTLSVIVNRATFVKDPKLPVHWVFARGGGICEVSREGEGPCYIMCSSTPNFCVEICEVFRNISGNIISKRLKVKF